MPLTKLQRALTKLLSVNRSEDSYLAGGAALHLRPNSKRYSNDLDYFHDSEKRVAESYAKDKQLLIENGYSCELELNQPGYLRAIVSKDGEQTKIEWAHDSAWRFMPTVFDEDIGYLLHPVDLAVNKVLALAGRHEARDFLDVLQLHQETLSLGALVWAACGKDPGFSPLSLLSLLERRGRYQPEDFSRLHLAVEVDLIELKQSWLEALEDARAFIESRPAKEVGCLYFSESLKRFVATKPGDDDAKPHFGRPGGVLPLPEGC